MAIETANQPVLDIDGTLARFGGDKELFIEMSSILLEDAPAVLDDLRSAVAARNPAEVRGRAHALKGLLAGCGGIRAACAAQNLEDAGQGGDLSNTASLLETLAGELDQLTRALSQYRA
jgi:HPt (histidine-containing phosphotransfer) domain-containing protein